MREEKLRQEAYRTFGHHLDRLQAFLQLSTSCCVEAFPGKMSAQFPSVAFPQSGIPLFSLHLDSVQLAKCILKMEELKPQATGHGSRGVRPAGGAGLPSGLAGPLGPLCDLPTSGFEIL